NNSMSVDEDDLEGIEYDKSKPKPRLVKRMTVTTEIADEDAGAFMRGELENPRVVVHTTAGRAGSYLRTFRGNLIDVFGKDGGGGGGRLNDNFANGERGGLAALETNSSGE